MKIIKFKDIGSDFYDYIEPDASVCEIINKVKIEGDKALYELTEKYDKVKLKKLKYNLNYKNNNEWITPSLHKALKNSAENIRNFAEKQMAQLNDFTIQTERGVFTGQRVTPIESIGIYVPGGNYPLISSLLMCAIPAKVAGVKEIIVSTPPAEDGTIPKTIIAAAKIADIDEIYSIGGAQAIAAMAYGTESIPPVDKIVGPGNKYVTAAKRAVYGRVGIDFLAGPTEVLIIADKFAKTSFIAADLIAQAEHDLDALPILVSDSMNFAKNVVLEIEKQIPQLRTGKIAKESIKRNGIIILCDTVAQIIELANKKAPEHLELQVKNPEEISNKLNNFGTLFIGENSAEALGDYSSGLNHTLPTNRSARYTGGLSVFDFIKISTTLEVTRLGLNNIGPVAEEIAASEGLDGHRKSVSFRLNNK